MKREKKKIKIGRVGFLMEGYGKWSNKTPKMCLISDWGKYEFKVYYPEFNEAYSHLTSSCAYQFKISLVKMSFSRFNNLWNFCRENLMIKF